MSGDPGMRFIGVPLDASPERLLGLRVGPASALPTPQEVLGALQVRLAQISANPRGRTSDADVTREALHAAARAILDRTVAPYVSQVDAEQARNIVHQFGGVTDETILRISHLASSLGIEPDALLAAALRPDADQLPSPVERLSTGADEVPEFESVSTRAVESREVVAPVRWFVYVGCGLVASMAVIAIGLALSAGPVSPVNSPVPLAESGRAEQTRGPVIDDSATVADESAPMQGGDMTGEALWKDHLRTLGDCRAMFETDSSAAVNAFVSTYRSMADSWMNASRDELLAAGNDIIDFLYGVESSERLRDIGKEMSVERFMSAEEFPDADAVSRAVFVGAMTVRVLREPDLPSSFRSVLRESCDSAFGGGLSPREQTVDEGIRTALSALPTVLIERMSKDPPTERVSSAWGSWMKGLATVVGEDSEELEREIADAIESVMTELPDADRDVRTREILSFFGGSLRWRHGGPARAALMTWFDNQEISAADLQALTSAIAMTSGAEGVDATMVISATADQAARALMRDRYSSSAHDVKTANARAEERRRWSAMASAELDAPIPSTHALGLLMAVRCARLSAVAEAMREGISTDAADFEPEDMEALSASMQRTEEDFKLRVDGSSNEREWALRYLVEARSGDTSARLSMLGNFIGPASPLSADVIVQEALRGNPEEIRQRARRIVRERPADPLLVNALLRMQPKMLPTSENSQLIEVMTSQPLPSYRSPSWRFEARRALVSKLIQLLALESPLGVVDAMAVALGNAYRPYRSPAIDQDAVTDSTSQAQPPGLSTDPLVAATEKRQRWQESAAKLVPSGREHASLHMIESSRLRRSELANGVIQRFHAEQLACVDLLAYSIVAERPAESAEVRSVLRAFEDRRREVAHVLDAIRLAEIARLELWFLRVGSGTGDRPQQQGMP